jgi:hypothetical protein
MKPGFSSATWSKLWGKFKSPADSSSRWLNIGEHVRLCAQPSLWGWHTLAVIYAARLTIRKWDYTEVHSALFETATPTRVAGLFTAADGVARGIDCDGSRSSSDPLPHAGGFCGGGTEF